MFSTILNMIPSFASEQMDRICTIVPKNDDSCYRGDLSFVTTLRALLINRNVKDKVTINLRCNYNYRKLNIDDNNMPELNATDENVINIYECTAQEIANVDNELTGFIATHKEHKELKDIELYLQKEANITVRIFYLEDRINVAIFTSDLNIRTWHLVQGCIRRYIPCVFKDKPITETEKNLLKSLTMRNANEYIEILEKLREETDIRSIVMETQVKDFVKNNSYALINTMQTKLTNIQHKIEKLREDWSRYNTECTSINRTINGLLYGIENNEDNNELYSYLKDHNNIDILNVNGSRIRLFIKGLLRYFVADEYKTLKENNTLERYTRGRIAKEDAYLLLDEIFSSNPTMFISIAGIYELDLEGGYTVWTYEGQKSNRDFIMNYHLDYHHCTGMYGPEIQKNMAEGKISLALENCLASVQSMNIMETTATFGPFIERFFSDDYSHNKMIWDKNGNKYTVDEAIKYIEENKKENKETIEFNNEESELFN